jgi:SAM-dependent methyltransferase
MRSDGQPAYDTIGRGYRAVRQPDPRLASKITTALGDSQTVVNVGAGAGSYEPVDRWVLALEPSSVMIAQRPPEAAPVPQTTVQDLPLADRSVDAAMAILTVHHWPDIEAGLRRLLRLVRCRFPMLRLLVNCTTVAPGIRCRSRCSASRRVARSSVRPRLGGRCAARRLRGAPLPSSVAHPRRKQPAPARGMPASPQSRPGSPASRLARCAAATAYLSPAR